MFRENCFSAEYDLCIKYANIKKFIGHVLASYSEPKMYYESKY